MICAKKIVGIDHVPHLHRPSDDYSFQLEPTALPATIGTDKVYDDDVKTVVSDGALDDDDDANVAEEERDANTLANDVYR
jgi:hypothetical protein